MQSEVGVTPSKDWDRCLSTSTFPVGVHEVNNNYSANPAGVPTVQWLFYTRTVASYPANRQTANGTLGDPLDLVLTSPVQ